MLQSGLMNGTSMLPMTRSSVNMRSRPKLPAVTSSPYTLAPLRTSGTMAPEGRVRVRMWLCPSLVVELVEAYMGPLPEQSHSFETPSSTTILLMSESLMGNLPVRCFEKLEASMAMRLANSDWVIPWPSINALILIILSSLLMAV